MSTEDGGIGPPVVAAVLVLAAVLVVSDPLSFARLLGMENQPGHDLNGLVVMMYAFGLSAVGIGVYVAWLLPVSATSHPAVAGVVPAALVAVGGGWWLLRTDHFFLSAGAVVLGATLALAWWLPPAVRLLLRPVRAVADR